MERFASTCIVEDVSPSLLKIMTRLSDALGGPGLLWAGMRYLLDPWRSRSRR